MRLDPIMIVVCDNPDCLGIAGSSKEIIRVQVAVTCGWARGAIDDYVDRVLRNSGWNVLPNKDFCDRCSRKEQENANSATKTTSTTTTPT